MDSDGLDNFPVEPGDIVQSQVICIEHPCIIKNIDKGIKSLGGQTNLERFLNYGDTGAEENESRGTYQKMRLGNQTKTIGVSLRPDDAMAKALESRQVNTNNILMRITVPKRTGRKRKRGSNDPFVEDVNSNTLNTTSPSLNSDPHNVLQALRDNPGRCSFEAVGTIEETHRFRGLPDAQYASTTNDFMNKFRKKVLPFNYSILKDFRLDPAKALDNTDVDAGPPAEYFRVDVPFNYSYLQNPLTYFAEENGNMKAINSNQFRKPEVLRVDAEIDSVPSGPVGMPPEEKLSIQVRQVIKELRAYFTRRPINTTRVLQIDINSAHQNKYYVALPYIGYTFKTGPWKNCIIKYGADPRSDPKYRRYQQISFKLNSDPLDVLNFDQPIQRHARTSGNARERPIYTFDGTHFTSEHCVWQICDITDSQLIQILSTSDLPTSCDIKISGWYHVGTIAKAKVIMRDKMLTLRGGGEVDPLLYERVIGFPEYITYDNLNTARVSSKDAYNETELKLLIDFRALVTTSLARARNVQKLLDRENWEPGSMNEGEGDEVTEDVEAENELLEYEDDDEQEEEAEPDEDDEEEGSELRSSGDEEQPKAD